MESSHLEEEDENLEIIEKHPVMEGDKIDINPYNEQSLELHEWAVLETAGRQLIATDRQFEGAGRELVEETKHLSRRGGEFIKAEKQLKRGDRRVTEGNKETRPGENVFKEEIDTQSGAEGSNLNIKNRQNIRGDSLYPCGHCKKQFSWYSALANHMVVHTRREKSYQSVVICGQTRASNSGLISHIVTHNKNGENDLDSLAENEKLPLCTQNLDAPLSKEASTDITRCEMCGNYFLDSTEFETHVKAHTDTKSNICTKCDRSFNDIRDLKNHMLSHVRKNNCCGICGKAFLRSDELTKHITVHVRAKANTCVKDIQTFSHTGDKSHKYKYKCEFCDKYFKQLRSLKNHVRSHTGEKPHVCDVCGKSFTTSSGMANHRKTHSGEKPYKCEICDMCFTVPATVRKHMAIHTGEKAYDCDICGKQYGFYATFRAHFIQKHTSEKPHKCDACDGSFKTKSELKRHYRIHTGVRPHECNLCGKSFTQSTVLKTHMRVHSGEMPYSCTVCGEKFKHSGSAKKHMIKHSQKPSTL